MITTIQDLCSGGGGGLWGVLCAFKYCNLLNASAALLTDIHARVRSDF